MNNSNDLIDLQNRITEELPNRVRMVAYGDRKQFIDISCSMSVFVPKNKTIYSLKGPAGDKNQLMAELGSVLRNAAARAVRGV
jgi:hypothetical protein